MTATSLRIALATPRFFPAQGGVENHVYQIARRFVQLGHSATVFTTHAGGANLSDRDSVEGVTVRRFTSYPAGSDLYIAPDLHRALRAEAGNFDVLHIQNYLTFVSPFAMAAAASAGLPYVVTFHGGGHSSRWRNGFRRAQGLLLRHWLLRASKLIATARFEVEYYGQRLKLPRDRFVFISNGADIAVRALTPVRVDPNLVISIGRLEQYKGHQRALAALPHLLKQRPEARLRILGEGPFEPELRRMAAALNVADRVEIGALPIAERQRMAETLSSAALVTLMSEFETQPMAALEAIALGRPVLVADTSGLSELAQQGYARAVPLLTEPDALAQAMLEHMNAPTPGPAGLKLPTWDDCASQLIALYSRVKNDKRRSGGIGA